MSYHPSRSREPCVLLSSGHGILNQVWMIKVLQLELRTFIAGNSKAAEKCSWKKKLLLLLWDLHLPLSSSLAQPGRAMGPGKVPSAKPQPGFTLGARPSAGQKAILSPSCKSSKLGWVVGWCKFFYFFFFWWKRTTRVNPRTRAAPLILPPCIRGGFQIFKPGKRSGGIR